MAGHRKVKWRSPTTEEIEAILVSWDHDWTFHLKFASKKFIGRHLKNLHDERQIITLPKYEPPLDQWREQVAEKIRLFFDHPDVRSNWLNLDIYPKANCPCRGCEVRRATDFRSSTEIAGNPSLFSARGSQ